MNVGSLLPFDSLIIIDVRPQDAIPAPNPMEKIVMSDLIAELVSTEIKSNIFEAVQYRLDLKPNAV
jgi:hypothetical protein